MDMSRIRVTIDHIVLRGVDLANNRDALLDGLRAELARVLADPTDRAAWARSHRTPVLRPGRMPLEPGVAGARDFGKRLARTVARGLKP